MAGPRQPHEDTLRFLRLIWREGDVREVRIPLHRKYRGVAAGWFDSPEKLAIAASDWDGLGNIFFSLNPVNPDLLARANNRIAANQRDTTPDSEVLCRALLLIDIDPRRPSGISSTDAELEAAKEVLDATLAYLTGLGWPEPCVVMSGNGYYLLYGIDLPNDAGSTALLKAVLEALNHLFKTEAAHIDTTVFNAARIAGLVGMMKVKGDETVDRRHRRSSLLTAPPELVPVTAAQLRATAGPTAENKADQPNVERRGVNPARRLTDILDGAGLEYREQPLDAAGITWFHLRRCPFHDDGRDFECGVGQNLSTGALAGHCFHPEGAGKGWQEFKAALGISAGRTPGIQSSYRATLPRVTDFPRTDSGNSELFTQLFGDRLRFDHRRGRWLLWRDHHWSEDTDGEIHRLAKDGVRQRYLAALALADLEERNAQARFAIQSENRQRLDALLELARNEIPIADIGDSWDSDLWLFGVANGVIDLRTGLLVPGDPDQLITNFTPISFYPEERCPRWLQFLDEVFEGDQELIDFIRMAIGYSLTGDSSEQCLFICHGAGSNGKTVLLGVLRALLGGYAYNAPFSTFEMNSRASIPNDLAQLDSRRLVTSSETNDGTRLNEARLKALTGGDPITARFLHREHFTFVSQAKFWLAVNHKPKVEDLTHGFWRRVRLVPFNRTFEDDQDKGLLAKLLRELPGILAWAVGGCLAWQERGLGMPAAVTAATESYRSESDPLGPFIEESCAVHANAQCGATEVFLAYSTWAARQGMSERERLNSTEFGTKLGARFQKKRIGKGRVYVGLGLLSERPFPDPDPTRVQGLVQGSESGVGPGDVFASNNGLTREKNDHPCTTLHPTQPEPPATCHCGAEIDSFAPDGSPRCAAHREVSGTVP